MNARSTSVFVMVIVALTLFISSSAHAAWSTNPSENTPVCTASLNQGGMKAVPDGEDGIIMVWWDYRPGNGDIYVQRLDTDGDVMWTADGVAVCTAADNQFGPNLVGDGSGGAVIAWEDGRSGENDIYAQHVDSTGAMLWAADGIAVCTAAGSQEDPVAVSDGAGGVIVAWKDERNGIDSDLYAQRIDSGGNVLWAADGAAVCTAAGDQEVPVAVSDDAGGMILAWEDGTFFFYDIYAQRIDSSGTVQWNPRGVSVCTANGDQSRPQITGNGNGGAVIVWQDIRSTDYDIYAQELDTSGAVQWTADGMAVCTATDTQQAPQLAGDGDGGIFIVWEDNRYFGSDIYAQRLDATGTALWAGDGLLICDNEAAQDTLRLAPNNRGGVFIVWRDWRPSVGTDIYAQLVDDWGRIRWADDGVVVCMAVAGQDQPWIGADGAGGAIVTWQDDRAGDSDIYAQQISWDGRLNDARWSHDTDENNPVIASDDENYSQASVSDDAGGVIVAWTDDRSGINDLYAQRIGAGGSAVWNPTDLAVCTAAGSQVTPEMVSDGAGGAIIAWKDNRSGDTDLYVQRIDVSGFVRWSANGVAVCTASGAPEYHRLIPDGSGGAIIAWFDLRSGSHFEAYVQRVDNTGSVLWTADGMEVCTASVSQFYPELVSDGTGGAIITWHDHRSVSNDIYAQRIGSSGTFLWISSGVVVCDTSADQLYPEMVSDGAGGAIIAWEDYRNGSDDIYTQRIDATGNRLWDTDGLPVCTANDTQENCRLVSDGAEGAIIVWEDYRSGSHYDVYAQHVNTAGGMHWPNNGVAVSAESGDQREARLVSDGDGGAFIAWEDTRSAHEDVYAQWVGSSGTPIWTSGGMPVCTAPMNQKDIQVVRDDGDTVIFVWGDHRAGIHRPDIYTQRLGRNGYPGEPAPAINSVADHPEDQGGVTMLNWIASCFDEFPNQFITHYSVWNRPVDGDGRSRASGDDSPEQGDESTVHRTIDDLTRAGWYYVDDVPATYQVEYLYNAPTYGDCLGTELPPTEYKVLAHTADPWIFWESAVETGCSVDNLSPGAPLDLLGEPAGQDVALSWTASGQDDEDLHHYNVYRSDAPGFTPDETTLIGTALDVIYTDPDPGAGNWYYRVSGEDVHGNEGEASNETSASTSTSTISVQFTCQPASGTVPFSTQMSVTMNNLYTGQTRRLAGRINVVIAAGSSFSNWKSGWTNVAAGSSFNTSWNQNIPALGSLIGNNTFILLAEDVTPSPYNQPPHPISGDTDMDACTVTGIAP